MTEEWAKAKVLKIVQAIPHDDWPEDDWLAVSDVWDLNIWSQEGIGYATLYPVVDGETQVQDDRRVWQCDLPT